MRKLVVLLALSLGLCGLISIHIDCKKISHDTQAPRSRKKTEKQKNKIADYFDINTHADAQDVTVNTVSATTQPPEFNIDDLSALFSQMAQEGDVKEIENAFKAEFEQLTDNEKKEIQEAFSAAFSAAGVESQAMASEVMTSPLSKSEQDMPTVVTEEKTMRDEMEDVIEDDMDVPDDENEEILLVEDENVSDEQDMGQEDEDDFAQEDDEHEDIEMMPGKPAIYRAQESQVDVKEDIDLVETSINIEKKREQCEQLVDRAAQYLIKNKQHKSFNVFSHTKEFVHADLYVFVYDIDGICLAHPQSPELLWKNLYDMQDSYGRYPIQDLIRIAHSGGGWVTYEWEGATKLAYAREVTIDGNSYMIGAGFFSHSKREAVISLVKAAVSFFKSTIDKGFSPDVAFSAFSYPIGDYIHGDLYTYVIAFDGETVAHGDDPGLIGSNALDVKDAQGQYVNRDIIKRLKNSSTGIWTEYTSKRAPKKVYAEKIIDKKGRQYFVACGYYPESNRKSVIDLVRKAYNYMKANGKTIAARAFTDPKNDDFRFGDLSIFVYDMNGVVVAHGNNPALVGKKRLDLVDGDGHHYVQGFIEKAESGGGWVNYKVNKLFRSSYVEMVDMGVEKYVIGSGLYPISKRENMILLVKGVSNFMTISDTAVVLREVVEHHSRFKRGDLSVFVLDESGYCLAYSDEYDLIWRNLINVVDDNGKKFIRDMIETAKHGPSLIKYKLNKAEKISYVESINKDGKNYFIGSGYYL